MYIIQYILIYSSIFYNIFLKNLVNKGMWYEQYETVNILVLRWSKLIIAQSQTEIVVGIFAK